MKKVVRWIISRLNRDGVDPNAVRAEAWALGGRHRGQVIEGARAELNVIGLTPKRSSLLKAVVRSELAKRPGLR